MPVPRYISLTKSSADKELASVECKLRRMNWKPRDLLLCLLWICSLPLSNHVPCTVKDCKLCHPARYLSEVQQLHLPRQLRPPPPGEVARGTTGRGCVISTNFHSTSSTDKTSKKHLISSNNLYSTSRKPTGRLKQDL